MTLTVAAAMVLTTAGCDSDDQDAGQPAVTSAPADAPTEDFPNLTEGSPTAPPDDVPSEDYPALTEAAEPVDDGAYPSTPDGVVRAWIAAETCGEASQYNSGGALDTGCSSPDDPNPMHDTSWKLVPAVIDGDFATVDVPDHGQAGAPEISLWLRGGVWSIKFINY